MATKMNIPKELLIKVSSKKTTAQPLLLNFLEEPGCIQAPGYVSAIRSTSGNDILDYDYD